MSSQSEQQSDNFPSNHDLAKDNQMFQALIQPRQSQPTKNKVKNFKNRVFQLLLIYADKCQNINTLLSSLKQEMFIRQPQKVRQLVNIVLNKQNVTFQMLQQLAQQYKVMLLYKAKKGANQLAEDFVRIVKKIMIHEENNSEEILKEMLKGFSYKRKCKIHADFFYYFLRKIPSLKQSFLQQCNIILKDINLRQAQKKQVQKLKLKLLKKNFKNEQNVKRQQNGIQQFSDKNQQKRQNNTNKAGVKKIKAKNVHPNQKEDSKIQNQEKKNMQSKKQYKMKARSKKNKDKKSKQLHTKNMNQNINKSSHIQKKQFDNNNQKQKFKKNSKQKKNSFN